jgi:hypothetical protein
MLDVFYHHRATIKFPDWAVRDFNASFSTFCDQARCNNEIAYSDLEYFKTYKDKKVFIIGGGPSTNATDLSAIERDFTWSLNHFYLSKRMQDVKVDLAMFMGEPDLSSKAFQKYRETHQPYIGFEVHDRWFNHTFDDYKKYFAMHTRFYGRVGAGVRMIIFACFLGCKEIVFTGFDGPDPIYEGDHAFEPGKKTLPSVYTRADKSLVLQDWKEQTDFFWEYIQTLFPGVKFTNVGGGERYHEKIR